MSARRDVPVADVVAALLIMLLLVVPGPVVKPPVPEPPPLPRRIVVSVQRDGAVRLGTRTVEIGKLRRWLEEIAGASDDVVVHVPRDLDFRRFEQVRAAVQGIGNVRMRVLPP